MNDELIITQRPSLGGLVTSRWLVTIALALGILTTVCSIFSPTPELMLASIGLTVLSLIGMAMLFTVQLPYVRRAAAYLTAGIAINLLILVLAYARVEFPAWLSIGLTLALSLLWVLLDVAGFLHLCCREQLWNAAAPGAMLATAGTFASVVPVVISFVGLQSIAGVSIEVYQIGYVSATVIALGGSVALLTGWWKLCRAYEQADDLTTDADATVNPFATRMFLALAVALAIITAVAYFGAQICFTI